MKRTTIEHSKNGGRGGCRLALLPQFRKMTHHCTVRNALAEVRPGLGEMSLHKAGVGARCTFSNRGASRFELAHGLQTSTTDPTSMLFRLDGVGMATVHLETRTALPTVWVVDLIMVARADLQVWIHLHRAGSPLLEDWAMRWLGRVIQQPRCHVAELVAQRALKLRKSIHHLAGQFHTCREMVGPVHHLSFVVGQSCRGLQLVVPYHQQLGWELFVKHTTVVLSEEFMC
mmetsp:Transcript_3405/g.21267  ORF Transcript_3405/g.21267 Transcript_3405/m.21267 type:complete len:230 (+) Transcript_3405:191-880(+)